MKSTNTNFRKARRAYLKQAKIVRFWARQRALHPTVKVIAKILDNEGFKLSHLYKMLLPVQAV